MISRIAVHIAGNITTHCAPRRASSRTVYQNTASTGFFEGHYNRNFYNLRRILVGATRASRSSERSSFLLLVQKRASSISHLPFSLHKRLNSLGWPERQLTHAGEESEREKCKDGPLWSFLQGARHPPALPKSPRPKGPGTHYAPRQHLPHLLAGRAGPARPGTYFPNAV